MNRSAPFSPPHSFSALTAWRSASLSRRLSTLLFALLTAFVFLTFRHYGLSNDEEVQHHYGQLLLDFYLSGFNDLSAFSYKNLYLYGGLFDLIAASFERVFHTSDVWELRHLLSGLFGLVGMAGAWQLARQLGGERVALVTLVLLTLTGAWLGAIFTHTKDVPFAACMTWALYYTTRVAERLPAPPLSLVAKLGIAVGCAMGLRVGAVFAVFYLLLTCAVAAMIYGATWPERARFLWRSALSLIPAGLIAFVLMAAFWPWSVMAPNNLYTAASTFSHFDFPLYTILDGQIYRMGDVPGYYLSYYLLVRLPELLLLGVLAAALFGAQAALRFKHTPETQSRFIVLLPLLLAVVFPLAFTLITVPALYNGIRHFLFIVPPLAVLSAIGLCLSWRMIRARAPRITGALVLALCGVLALDPLITMTRLHPYEYVYYNRLVAGGMAHAVERWEVDYWSSSLREASLQLNAYVAHENRPRVTYEVAICAEPIQGDAYLNERFRVTRDWHRADFFITALYQGCENAMKGPIIGTVSRMGVPLAIVRDRRDLRGADRTPK